MNMQSLLDRLRFWVGVAALLTATLYFAGFVGVVVLFALASLQALREFLTYTHTRRADHWALIAAFFVILPFQYILVGIEWYGMASIMIPVYAFLGMPIVSVLRRDTTRFMERVAEVQWGLMTCVYCLSYVPALHMLQIEGFEGRGLLLVLFLGLIVQGAEWICAAGTRLLARAHAGVVSLPQEFALTAVAGALIGAGLCWFTPFDFVQAASLGAVAASLGLSGSLVMEAVRRDRGLEAWSRSSQAEDHNPGLLGRLERIAFAAPVFFHFVRYWWTT
jgi:phosphatidate cytidylyltransferase